MSSSNLIRWSGLGGVVGGVLLAAFELLESTLFSGQPESVSAVTSSWIIIQVGYLVAFLLLTLALVGLYALQVEQAGSLGLTAFLVALTGIVLMAGSQWGAAFLGPWIAEAAPELIDAEPAGITIFGYILSMLLVALGFLLFGLASLRTKVLPRGAAMLLMAGAVLLIVLEMLELPIITVVLDAALIWMGYALWKGAGQPSSSPSAA
jgi:hypothetical protein